MEPLRAISHTALTPLVCVLIIGAGLAVFKLDAAGLTLNSDYASYLETAELFRGAPDAAANPGRILKPLAPLSVAALETALPPGTAFLVQVVVFYFLLIAACYALGRAFGFAAKESALLALLLGASYPVLRYGVDLYTETGALFFCVLSFALTLRYLRAPGWRVLLINSAVITLGFLWKEYSAVAALAFGLAILAHPALSWRERFRDLFVYVGVFAVVNLAWEIFVYTRYHYTYLSWYHQAGEAGFKTEFTAFNIAKSLAALLGLGWLLVPFGLARVRGLAVWQKRFLLIAIPASCMAFFWGYVSSRLFFIIAPAFALIAVLALSRVRHPAVRYGLVCAVLAGNVAWLLASA
ncbi:MAG: glycosyltransferase family 39 protein [bacterium]